MTSLLPHSTHHFSLLAQAQRGDLLRWSTALFAICGAFFNGCDDATSSQEMQGVDRPQVIAELHFNEPSALQGLSELSFPLPNDELFSKRDAQWVLRPSLNESVQLRNWANDVSLLGGAPLTPLISVPLTDTPELESLLARQRSRSLLDDAIYLICVSQNCLGEVIPLDFGDTPVSYGLFSELNALAESEGAPTPQHLTELSLPLPPALTAHSTMGVRTQTSSQLAELSELLQESAETLPLSSLIWSTEQQQIGQHRKI